MRLKELCIDERPREKMLEKGTQALANVELLAILLRTGTGKMNVLDVARELLRSGDGKLGELASMPIERLCSIGGIGTGKAVSVAAAFELGRRAALEDVFDKTAPLTSPKTVSRLMLPGMKLLDHEECWVLFLNKANRLLSREMLTSGGQDSTIIDNRLILRKALEKKASAVILVHNHPSGNPLPSAEDIRQTRSLAKALQTCDLRLLDHLIISAEGYYSFADDVQEKF